MDRRFPNIRAIVIGSVTDISGTFVLGLVLVVVFGAITGLTPEQVGAALESGPMYAALFVIGAAMSMVGGYIGARIAGFRYLEHGAVVGLVSAGFGIVMSLTDYGSAGEGGGSWVGYPLTVLLSALGGHIAWRRRFPDG